MSKAAKQSILILIILILGSLGFAGYTYFEKMKLEEANEGLNQKLTQSDAREKKNLQDIKQLQGTLDGKTTELTKVSNEKNNLDKRLSASQAELARLGDQVNKISQERDLFKNRVDEVSKIRDELVTKLKEKTEAEKAMQESQQSQQAKAVQPQTPVMGSSTFPQSATRTVAQEMDEDTYWADVVKQKAELEVKISHLEEDLSGKVLEIVGLKQENADFQIEIDNLKQEKSEVEREIKYKSDLVNNLSLELARTKNDKKFLNDKFEKMSVENKDIRAELKKLVNVKGALEKNIVKLSDEKSTIEKQLTETDSIIQSKIDEIWEVKDSIDETFKTTRGIPKSDEVELPPIVVSTEGSPHKFQEPLSSSPGFNGKIVSINEENNFVIVDIGENSGIKTGDILSVYRDSKYIARLEVIQVRKDISAADIKDQWTKPKAGDIVR